MKRVLSFLIVFSAVFSVFANTDTPSWDPENLISHEFFKKQLSWMNPGQLWSCYIRPRSVKVENEVMILTSPIKPMHASIPMQIGYETADRFQLSFEYKLKGTGSADLVFQSPVKKLKKARIPFPLKSTAKWVKFNRMVQRVRGGVIVSAGFNLARKGGRLEVRNLRLKPFAPVSSSKEEVILAGKKITGIFYLKGDFHSMYSAKMFRSQLWRIKNIVLDLKACTQSQLNAVKNGVIFTRGGKTGKCGYELVIAPGKAVIRSGKTTGSGLELGVMDLLRRLGIEYLTTYTYTVPKKLHAKACRVKVNPAIPYRITPWAMEMPELMGYSNPVVVSNFRKVGGHRGFGHSVPYFLPFNEFSKTNPEFYALQEDGKRLRRIPGKRFDVHFCMSNKKAQKIIASRLIEFIRSEPLVETFDVNTGDGGNKYCRCKECMKMGKNLGEIKIAWVNAIGKIVAKEFPNVKLSSSAYVDSRFPPETVLPDKNVVICYCPYGPVWMNHLINEHPDNAQGLADLKKWEEKCPKQMSAFDYPSSCREKLNIWPAFYANYGRFKRYAEKKYQALEYCGFSPVYAGGSIPASSFTNLSLYVFSKVIIDPRTNVEKEIDRYMKLYYGPAAKAMRAYFDLAHKEVRDRKWSQNTERIIRGFVTKPFAAKCYALFAQAEKAAKGTIYYDRVRQDKLPLLWSDLTDNCRGNGKISSSELPAYAEKLAEFCRICKKYGYTYNTIPYKNWFWDTAVLHIKGRGAFYHDPMVLKLMKDPVKTLVSTAPDVQKKTPYGYFIPNAGLMGGERRKTLWLTSKAMWASCLRRASSGFGVVQFVLKLDKVPRKAVLEIYGIDNEKKDPALMKIEVNGKKIFEGKSPWEKDDWTTRKFTIPAGILHRGENNIVIFNTTPDTEVDGEGGVNYVAKRNYFWGWFMIRDVKIRTK